VRRSPRLRLQGNFWHGVQDKFYVKAVREAKSPAETTKGMRGEHPNEMSKVRTVARREDRRNGARIAERGTPLLQP